MLNFPQEILNSKKTITIAVDENNELIFSTDNIEGEEWKPWELYGAIQFASQTFGLPTSKNAAEVHTEANLTGLVEVPEMIQLEIDFPEISESHEDVQNFEQKPQQGFISSQPLPKVKMGYSEAYPWLK